MDRFLDKLTRRARWLGVIASLLLTWGSLQLTGGVMVGVQDFVKESEQTQNLTWAAALAQRGFALSVAGNITEHPQLRSEAARSLKQASQAAASEVEVIRRVAKLEKQLVETRTVAKLARTTLLAEQTSAEILQLREKKWQAFITSSQNLLEAQQNLNLAIIIASFLLSVVLLAAALLSWRKEKAEKALRQQEQQYQILFTSLSEGVILCRADGTISAANQSAGLITNRDVRGLIGEKIESAFPHLSDLTGRVLSGKSSPLYRAMQKGEALAEARFGFEYAPELHRWIELRAQPLLDPEEEEHHSIIFSFVDITSKLETEAQVKSQQAMMVQASKMTALGEMAGGIAHEINNPLSVISSAAQRLKKKASQENLEGATVTDAMGKIQNTVDRIAGIVRGLLTFSRSESKLDKEEVPLKNIVDDALEVCRLKLNREDVNVEVEGIGEMTLTCMPLQIGQVIINLVNNAIDAMEGCEERKIWIQVKDAGDVLFIGVTDSGNGLDAELRAQIFQPYFTTKKIGKGTGLGLSISRTILENHGGTLALDEKSQNTRFVMRLPKRPERNEKAA